jgi:hypothetical protein
LETSFLDLLGLLNTIVDTILDGFEVLLLLSQLFYAFICIVFLDKFQSLAILTVDTGFIPVKEELNSLFYTEVNAH